jgi:NADH dehydrogenase
MQKIMQKKKVIVLGAGFGGLRAAMDLAKGLAREKLLDAYEVVLVDQNDCHLYTPLLYRLAADPTSPKNVCTYDVSALIKNLPIRFLQDKVGGIDLPKQEIRLENGGPIKADHLVIALGSETNYFDIPGLKENALELKTAESALTIKDTVTKAFMKGGNVSIVVGGAGSNGIELAAELRLWANRSERENRNLHVRISLVEALPNVLPGFDARVIAATAGRLAGLHVEVKTNAKITAVGANKIAMDGSGTIPFNIFVWTGGIKTPELVSQLPVQKDLRGKPLAGKDLALYPNVYGVGDGVSFINPKTNRSLPAVAPVAIAQAKTAAWNILEAIRAERNPGRRPRFRSYHHFNYPYVVAVGGTYTVAKIGPLVLSGWPAWIFKKLVELDYLLPLLS